MLAAEGETILYVSSHGPFEKGKDIVTRTPDGEVRAYQLKAGDIGVAGWRAIHGEIVNLVELPIESPGKTPVTDFVPYLVTNGELTDPVMEQIRAANVGWQARGMTKALHTIQKGELFERFRASHGAYLPRDLEDFRTFIELILHDGSAPADKEKAAQLIEHILPTRSGQRKAQEVARAAASLVLLTGYITGPAALALNHWSLFEYWVTAGAYILYLMEKHKKAGAACRASFEICEMAADNALGALVEECKARSDLVQGLPLVDGHTYRARATVLIGLLSAWDLSLRIRRKERKDPAFVQSFLESHLKEASVWGESAVPYLFLAALEISQNSRPLIAEELIIQLVREISAANGHLATGRGLPNPYYSPEEALRLACGLDHLNREQFSGFSYSIASLIDFLARRWRRRAIASLWYRVTRLSFASYVPATSQEWFRWRSTDGALSSTFAREPQSWEELRTKAENIPLEGLPQALVCRPAFALWFALVYPQRFTRSVAKLIEDAVWSSGR